MRPSPVVLLLLAFLSSFAIDLSAQGPGPCGAGNVGLGAGGPLDLLRVNGSTGGAARRVDIPMGSAINIGLDQPATNSQPASFAIFGAFGIQPVPFVLPFGIGTMCFPPSLAAPGNPAFFTVADSLNLGVPQFAQAPVSQTPYLESFGTINAPALFTLQAVIFEAGVTLRVSNAVVVSIYDPAQGAAVVATSYVSTPNAPGGLLPTVFTDEALTLTFDAALDATSLGGLATFQGAPLQLTGRSPTAGAGILYQPFVDQAAARQSVLLYDDASGQQVPSYLVGRLLSDPRVLVIDPRVSAAYQPLLGIAPAPGLASNTQYDIHIPGGGGLTSAGLAPATLRRSAFGAASALQSGAGPERCLHDRCRWIAQYDRSQRR